MPEAFVRSIRDLGYRSNGDSIAEFVDNALEAQAKRIDLLFDYDPAGSPRRPVQLAILDNGNGMSPEAIRRAVRWGGTDRENDRTGLGRYGFGLPCGAVSLGRRFTVYSRTRGRGLYKVTLDLDELAKGAYRDNAGRVVIPTPKPADLPPFIVRHIAEARNGRWRSGTIVLLDKLDRLQWVTSKRLADGLAAQLGVTYNKLLRETVLYIDEQRVEPIDPLFLSAGYRFYDLDDDRAEALEPAQLDVTHPETNDVLGVIRVRYAWLPPSFGSVDKGREAVGLNANDRFPVLKRYHGILFSRNGRLIDVHARTPWTTFINNDRYIKVEVEFSASLDELFGVTTSKQQVTVSPFIWDVLQSAGVPKAIEQLRNKLREAKAARQTGLSALTAHDGAAKISIEHVNTGQSGQGRFGLEPVGHRIALDHAPGEAFFSVIRRSRETVLRLNMAHRFFSQVYTAQHSTNETRAALELLLLCAASAMGDSDAEQKSGIAAWSRRLNAGLQAAALRQAENDPQQS